MKLLSSLVLGLFSISVFANVSLEFELATNVDSKSHHIRKILKTEFDQIQRLKIPNSNQEIELVVSKKLPQEISRKGSIKDAVLVQINVFELTETERKKVSSGRMVTRLNQEASMQQFKQNVAGPVLELKLKPRKL